MSSYLVDRLLANPTITVRGGTEVTRLDGGHALESISLVGPAGEPHEQDCHGLFCFIGAEPATGWLTGVALDEHGFVRTDVELTTDELGETWSALGRRPLPFETSVPGVFAVGDVRHGSVSAWLPRSAKAQAPFAPCTPHWALEHESRSHVATAA